MKTRILILCLCALLFTPPAAASGPPDLPAPDSLSYRALPFSPPQAQRMVMENGMVLYVLEDHELPLVDVSAVFRAGSALDPADRAGLAELTARVMRTGGTRTTDGGTIDDILAFHGISLGFSAEADFGSAHLSALRPDWIRGFEIFAQMLMSPAFEEAKLSLAKALMIEDLRGVADDPPRFAFREFRRILYRGDPRGNLPTRSSIGAIGRPDLMDFHRRFVHPQGVMIAITGDVTLEEAAGAVRRCLGDWRSDAAPARVAAPAGGAEGTLFHLQKKVPQSVIVSGRFAPSKRDDDFYPFTVLDFILGGGGFRSRIFQEVRSNRGLAYSTGSFYRARADYGLFGIYALTKSSSTLEVLSLMRGIVRDLKEKGIVGSELAWAKKSLNNGFIFSFQSADHIAQQQMMIEYDGLPRDFLSTFRTRIDRVSDGDVRNVASRYFGAGDMTTLLLGDEKAFDRPLSGFGQVIRMEDRHD